MSRYLVNVRRIVREEMTVAVEADTPEEAIKLAAMDATSFPQENWDCYDCEYWCDDDAAERQS